MLILRTIKFLNLDTISFKTISANKKTVNKDWILVDANGQNLGRLASRIAILLRGKNKPNFSPHVDCGDNVVVINSAKINLTGKKWSQKSYIRYTGYPGGQRSLNATELFNKNPNTIITLKRKFKKDFFDFAKLDFAYLISLSIFFFERSILATKNTVAKIKTKSIKIIFPMN